MKIELAIEILSAHYTCFSDIDLNVLKNACECNTPVRDHAHMTRKLFSKDLCLTQCYVLEK